MRDPLVIFDTRINLNNKRESAHFENIQSTNWNCVRLKPPPSFESTIGWRTEFRTMEISLTDDENAAFSILSSFFVRILTENDTFKFNLYIPMDKMHANFERAK